LLLDINAITLLQSLRLVQLDKLRLQTRAKEEEQSLARGGKDPFIVVKNPSASKGGVAETSIKVSGGKKKFVKEVSTFLKPYAKHVLSK
jgi:hypothetical protein